MAQASRTKDSGIRNHQKRENCRRKRTFASKLTLKSDGRKRSDGACRGLIKHPIYGVFRKIQP